MNFLETEDRILKKAIIIGAGVSGLAAGIRLLAKGYDVEIYEKNEKPGGRMNQIDLDGFLFDQAPTILMMPEIYKEVFTDAGVNPDDYLKMTRLDPIYKVYYKDGKTHTASSELSRLTAGLEAVSEADTEGYLAYLADTYKRYRVAKDHFITKPFRYKTDFYNPKTLYQGLKLRTFDNAYHSVSKFVKDKRLQEMLSFQTLYIGISPYNGPSIYTIIPMIELIYGVWFLEGGMYAMVEAMVRLFKELGGRIHLNAPVRELIIEKNTARGFITEAGETVKGDIILNTSDFPYALDELLPDYKDGKYRKANLQKLEYSCSCLMFYLGLDNRDYPGLDVHNFYFTDDFDGNIRDVFDGRYPADASVYAYAPALQDPSLAPEGQLGLYVLVPVPNLKDGKSIDWQDEKTLNDIREDVFNKLELITPLKGFRDHLIREKVFTPADFKESFNLMNGATFGLKPTLFQSNNWRPQAKARKIENLYFAGSSNHPGAGVPIVLTSAKIAAEEIQRDHD